LDVAAAAGIDDNGQAASTDAGNQEVTPYTTLRDHTSKVYFYRWGGANCVDHSVIITVVGTHLPYHTAA
jgi:hypothetical protein